MSNIEDDVKIIKYRVQQCREEFEDFGEITFIYKDLDKIEHILSERDQDKARMKELENKLHEINEYILINGIDEPLKTATQIQVENHQHYIIQQKINLLEKRLENSIPKQKVKNTLDDIYDYFERLNGPDEDIEYIESKRKELLEEGE